MKIWPPGLVQGYNLAIYNRVGGKIPECLNDLWESFVEVLVIPRVQDGFAARSDSDGAVAVKFDLEGPIWSLGKRGNQGAFHRLDELGFPFRMRLSLCAHVSAHGN